MLLWDVDFLSEIVLIVHEIGHALVRDVEQVDEGLYIASLQQTGADALSRVVLMIVGILVDSCGLWVIFFILLADFAGMIVVVRQLIEQDGRSQYLGRLLERLDLALFLSVLD